MSTPDHVQQHTVSATELFAHSHQVLRRNVRAIVNTSDENIEDACMFAWTKFLSWEFERVEDAIAFEKRLKGWKHNKKRAFAERDWPALKHYSAGR